uniref:Ankyrin repeat domain-containing protein 26 n=1 Tax=Phallusia mammillata TaxID=59560 RepID=A0A6F9D6Y5_9ASCI|nr:ankyrin repeat domain-containing protein 26 [Phallusia mammillata]
MKRFFKKKKSASETGSLASGGKSESGYNIQTKKELTKLHKAAFTGDLSKLKSLLKKGDVNQLDKENRTPLHLACSNGKIDAIIMLAGQHGCNLNLCDNDKRSPLMILVQCQFYNCMNVLLQKDADVNLSDINGNTALHLAASIPSSDLCISLIDYHADVHAKNKDGSTPLHLASSAAESENVIKTLLDDGAQINAKENNGKTPLMLAASRGHLEVVKDLLSQGADSSLRDAKGWCADDYASMSGHHPISHVIVEHSVKQKKTPSRQSLQNVSTGSGSRLYEDIPAVSVGNKKTPIESSSNFLVGGPAMDAGDLSQDDESQTVSRISDKDSWNSDSDSSPPLKSRLGSNAGAPKVNVAQFLKQREQNKNQPSSSSANQSPITTKPQSVFSAKSPSKDNMEVTDSSSQNTALRSRGYASNSQKGGQVSPAKPPLPKGRSNGMQSPALHQRGTQDDDEDSPWDSEEESDGDVQEQMKDDAVASPARHMKPSRDIINELGLSAADINQIYDNNESDMSSMRSQSPEKPTPSTPIYSQVQRKKKLSLDQSDSEEENSSSWDDESDIEEGPRDKQALTDIIAESSAFKFDDEISDQDDDIERAAAPSSVLQQIEANEVRDDDNVDDDSSSWDSENVVERPSIPQSSPLKTSVDGVLSPSDDDDDEFDTESESSWEAENRKKHDNAKIAKLRLEEERKQREKEEEERLREERQRLQKEKEELQRREEAKRQEEELRRQEEEEKQRRDALAEEKRKQQAKKDKQMKIAMEAMEKKRKSEEDRKRKEEEVAERLRLEAEEKRKADENLRKERKDAEDKRRKEVEEKRRLDEEKRKRDEEDKRMREEEQRRRLLASTEKEKLKNALQNALDGAGNPSESDISEFDDFHMGNVQGSNKRKMEGFKHSNVSLPPMYTRRDPSFPNQKSNGIHGVNGIDIDNLTGTETETEDDFPADVPASLQASQLSESLLRSGERGELEREASREKHRAIDALEQLDISKRENEKLRDEIRNLKVDKKEGGKIRDDLEARMRKMNFDLNRTKEELQSAQLEVDTSRDRHNRLEQKLEIDASERRKQESALVELRSELGHTEMRLKEAERDRDKLQTELSVERRKMALREHVDNDKQRSDAEMNEQTSTIQRQVDAWNLLLQEKDDELCKAKAGLATMESTCNRYKEELARSRSNEDDDLLRINSQLNDRVMEMEQNWRESREALEHAAVKYNLQLHHLKQANEMLTDELRKERKQKSDSQHDLETLNDQQRSLKDRIGEMERKCYREEDKSEALTRNVKEEKEKREDAEKKYRDAEISTNLAQQEANSLRTALTHKDSLLIQAQREREEAREKLSRSEKEANELQRENVRMSGRVEILEAEVSQQESEKMRMRRELEDARNFGTSTLTAQQGQLSEIVTGQQKERIELEKRNAQLDQQVSHLRDEIKRVSDEKLKKEEELAIAQQDYIETHKRMSFTEPSMAQMREEKNKMEIEIQQLKERCSYLDTRLVESTRAAEDLRNELEKARENGSNAHNRLQSVETISAHDKSTIEKLEERLKTAEAANAR